MGGGRHTALSGGCARSAPGAEPATGRKGARVQHQGDFSMEGAEAEAQEGAAVARDLLTLG